MITLLYYKLLGKKPNIETRSKLGSTMKYVSWSNEWAESIISKKSYNFLTMTNEEKKWWIHLKSDHPLLTIDNFNKLWQYLYP